MIATIIAIIASLLGFGIFQAKKRGSAEGLLDNLNFLKKDLPAEGQIVANQAKISTTEEPKHPSPDTEKTNQEKVDFWNKR